MLPVDDRSQSRLQKQVKVLELMATADMFGGTHGAGLGHAKFLQPGSALFEIKVRGQYIKKLFMNMANLNEVGYYAFDARSYDIRDREQYKLNSSAIAKIVDGLWQAWQAEAAHRDQQEDKVSGECEFPNNLRGSVSSFSDSRCYLQKHNGQWHQCMHTDICFK
jgi:hypothetical protein